MTETKKQMSKKWNYVKSNFDMYLMILPALVTLFVFCYIPYYGLTLAFKEYIIIDGIIGSPYVGLQNYIRLFSDSYFVKVLLNTLKISVLNFVIGYPVPIIITIFMNEMLWKRYKSLVQTLIYLPYFISWVVLAGILSSLLGGEGALSIEMKRIFGYSIPFYSDGNWFIVLLIVSNIWKSAGWGTIIYLAAISNINPALYEAATVDGAGRFQRILHITLPGLTPAITITLIMSLSGLMQGNFDQIFNMYNKLVYDKADIIQTYIYRIGIFDGEYGISTALGLFESLIGFVLIVISNAIAKKITGDGIW